MKTVLITGGTGAIGAALVREFARDCEVYFTFLHNQAFAVQLEQECGATGFCCDVTDRMAVDKVTRLLPKCDLLINNAGIAQIKLFTDITELDWYRMMDVHLTGAFNFTQSVLPQMIHRKDGCVIHISSVWGSVGASCEVHYSTAKAGLIGFTKALAKEVGLSGIRVNCIAPGVIDGGMNAQLNAQEMEALCAETPLQKVGTPVDVAQAARYLFSAAFVTGQVLGVDGGFGL